MSANDGKVENRKLSFILQCQERIMHKMNPPTSPIFFKCVVILFFTKCA